MTTSIVISIIGLIVVICVHIVVIARWSGKIDGFITAFAANFARIENEVEKLRAARHIQEGTLQRHEGLLREFERRGNREQAQR